MTDVRLARRPDKAAAESYDVAVVGGGIQGVAVAFESARRGLHTILLEANDFGGETTRNGLRIVHGGLRYLQSLDIGRSRASAAEQRWFLRHFPDLIRPLPCLMPLYGRGFRRPAAFRLAFLAERTILRAGGLGAAGGPAPPPGRLLDAADTLRRFPEASPKGLIGGALWHDAVISDPGRLVIELLRWASACGATALNYVAATGLLEKDKRVVGLRAVDKETGDCLEFRAATVVNCAGPRVREVAKAFDRDLPALFHPSLAFNLLLDREPLAAEALAVTAGRAAPNYFLVPLQGRVLAGTFHAASSGSSEAPRPTTAEIETFVGDLARAVPALRPAKEAVLRVAAGWLPTSREGSIRLATRGVIHDHGAGGGPVGLVSVSGVKLTTARLVAEKAVRHLCRRLGRPFEAARAVESPVPAAPPGTAAFRRLCEADPAAARAMVEGIVEAEAVRCLDDLLLRRTQWGLFPEDEKSAGALVRDLLGPELPFPADMANRRNVDVAFSSGGPRAVTD